MNKEISKDNNADGLSFKTSEFEENNKDKKCWYSYTQTSLLIFFIK